MTNLLSRRPPRSRAARRIGTLAEAVGVGMAAGLVGTAAMTISQRIEARLRHREPDTTPVRAASHVLGVAPVDRAGERRFNAMAHWGYGTAWGAVRGVLTVAGLGDVAGTAAHLVIVWSGEQIVVPSTGASTPLSETDTTETAIDLGHHVVYAVATGVAHRWLSRR